MTPMSEPYVAYTVFGTRQNSIDKDNIIIPTFFIYVTYISVLSYQKIYIRHTDMIFYYIFKRMFLLYVKYCKTREYLSNKYLSRLIYNHRWIAYV